MGGNGCRIEGSVKDTEWRQEGGRCESGKGKERIKERGQN